MKKKLELDLAVAADLGINKKQVALITAAFVQELKNTIMEDGVAYVDSLGRFKLMAEVGGKRAVLKKGNFKKGQNTGTIVVDVPVRLRVHFAKAPAFKQQLHEGYKGKWTSSASTKTSIKRPWKSSQPKAAPSVAKRQ